MRLVSPKELCHLNCVCLLKEILCTVLRSGCKSSAKRFTCLDTAFLSESILNSKLLSNQIGRLWAISVLDSLPSNKLATALFLPFPEEYCFCSLQILSPPWERCQQNACYGLVGTQWGLTTDAALSGNTFTPRMLWSLRVRGGFVLPRSWKIYAGQRSNYKVMWDGDDSNFSKKELPA